jgi:hypothetical protein
VVLIKHDLYLCRACVFISFGCLLAWSVFGAMPSLLGTKWVMIPPDGVFCLLSL